MSMYDNDKIFNHSFDKNFISQYLIHAQWTELIEFKKAITEIYSRLKREIKILDIGIGNARVPQHLFEIKEIWDKIDLYFGIDNSNTCINASNDFIAKNNLTKKVKVELLDATNIATLNQNFDVVICTWFTPGNFYPSGFSFSNYANAELKLNLDSNKKFENIFQSAYNLLNPQGELILGAVYIDNNETRIKQELSYQKMQMQIITSKQDSFTATTDGFWSQRFTNEKLFNYLHFISIEKFRFIPLDTYQYAMQVRILK